MTEIITHLLENNGRLYNMHKAAEELQELALVLNQKILKPTKVDDQEIIDEIGDVLIRMEIIRRMFPEDKINERVNLKLTRYREYIDSKEYIHI